MNYSTGEVISKDKEVPIGFIFEEKLNALDRAMLETPELITIEEFKEMIGK